MEKTIKEINKSVMPVMTWITAIICLISLVLRIFKITFNPTITILVISILSIATTYIIDKYGYIWDFLKTKNKVTSKLNDFILNNG
jgi:uncharacterized membrane protein